MSTFLRPNYGHGCFADLPPFLLHTLTGAPLPAGFTAIPDKWLRRYDKVIFLLVDGFGWRFFQQYADQSPALRRLQAQGEVLRWTSQFPSTTSAHVTCLHTGLTPGHSGVFEWQFYEPSLDAVIEPLTFSFAGDTDRETLRKVDLNPARIYPAQTIYQHLRDQGVNAFVYQHRDYSASTYTKWITRGAKTQRFTTLPEAFVNLRIKLNQAEQPTYAVLYFDKIDNISHHYGPESLQLAAEIESFLFSVERTLLQPLDGKAKDTLLVLTADHGQVEVDPRTTIYLNTDARCKGLLRYLRTNAQGEFILPGGSPRDVFLYIKDVWLDEAQTYLAERLSGKADVIKTATLIEQGYFGPPPLSLAFLERVGNLVVLPYAGESVWWYEKDRSEQRFYGHHGGLTPQEMEIPVCLYELG